MVLALEGRALIVELYLDLREPPRGHSAALKRRRSVGEAGSRSSALSVNSREQLRHRVFALMEAISTHGLLNSRISIRGSTAKRGSRATEAPCMDLMD